MRMSAPVFTFFNDGTGFLSWDTHTDLSQLHNAIHGIYGYQMYYYPDTDPTVVCKGFVNTLWFLNLI